MKGCFVGEKWESGCNLLFLLCIFCVREMICKKDLRAR